MRSALVGLAVLMIAPQARSDGRRGMPSAGRPGPRLPLRVAVVLGLLLGCGLVGRGHAPTPRAPLDLNSASLRQVEKLPGVTPSMAKRIVGGRPYARAEDLVDRGILTRHELDRLEDAIIVGKAR